MAVFFQSWIRLLIALSALIALASGQTVTVGGNLTNTIQNSGNSFKPISKNSGNVFKNQYQIDVNSGDEEEERQNEVETEKNNGNPDVLRQLDLLQRVSQSNMQAYLYGHGAVFVDSYICGTAFS